MKYTPVGGGGGGGLEWFVRPPQHPAELDARLKVRVDEPTSRNSCLRA